MDVLTIIIKYYWDILEYMENVGVCTSHDLTLFYYDGDYTTSRRQRSSKRLEKLRDIYGLTTTLDVCGSKNKTYWKLTDRGKQLMIVIRKILEGTETGEHEND